ncbi:Homeodomain-like protein, partial [Aspergillus pseudoustus]
MVHPPASMMIRQRRNWTPEEDVILKREVKRAQLKGDNVSWHSIAAFLPGRTNKDCRKRWYGTAAVKVRKGPWTEAEDERLRKAIERHGTKWAVVGAAVGTRLPDQCSKRWSHAINPEIDHSPWTPQEDQMLIQNVNKHGHYWQQIVSLYLPGRSSLAAKNRYHILQRRVEKELRQVGDGLPTVDSSCSWQEVVWEGSRGRGDRDLFSSTISEPRLGATLDAASFHANPSLMNWLSMAPHRPIPHAHTESMTPSRGGTFNIAFCLIIC